MTLYSLAQNISFKPYCTEDCADNMLAVLGTCRLTYTFTPPSVGRFTSGTTIGVGTVDYDIKFVGCGISGPVVPAQCLVQQVP